MVTEIKLDQDLTKWQILLLRDLLNALLKTDLHFSLGTKGDVGIVEFFSN